MTNSISNHVFILFHKRLRPALDRAAFGPLMGVFIRKTEFFAAPDREFDWFGRNTQFFANFQWK
jgi:hypothetical protein